MFQADVYTILLAFTSDVLKPTIDKIEKTIWNWNCMHEEIGVHFIAKRWDRHIFPDSTKADCQEPINEQLVDQADIGIIVFKARVGTETAKGFPGGAIEELDRLLNQKKQAWTFFYRGKIHVDHDGKQLDRLKEFKKNYKRIYQEWKSPATLCDSIERFLSNYAKSIKKNSEAAPSKTDFALTPIQHDLIKNAAKDISGTIYHRRWLGGQGIQAGKTEIYKGKENREISKYLEAIDQLVSNDFLTKLTMEHGARFVLTNKAYSYLGLILTENAQNLLRTAYASTGRIFLDQSLTGWDIYAGENIVWSGSDQRILSTYKALIEELKGLNLITLDRKDGNCEEYSLSKNGFDYMDRML